MSIFDYIFFSMSVFGSYAVGTALCKTGPVQSFIIGVLSQGLILGVTVWFLPGATSWILASIQLSSVLFVIFQKKASLLEHAEIVRKGLVQPSMYAGFLLALIFANSFTLHEYPFNSHDSVYWGYVFESLHADYSGPIRSPILAPLPLPVTHVLPIMSLTTLLAYLPTLTLINVIVVKHLVVLLFFWRAGWFLLAEADRKTLAFAISLFVSLIFIFESELGYNLMVSSFIYEIILLELVVLLAASRINLKLVLIFFLVLIAARASLSFAAMGASGILAWHLKNRLGREIWLVAVVVAINVATWLFLPKPLIASAAFLCSEARLKIVNPLSLDAITDLSAISDWVLPSSVTHMFFSFIDTLQNQYQVEGSALNYWIVTLFLTYTFLKFFLPIFVWIQNFLQQNGPSVKFSANALLLYLTLLWGGMFVIRIGGSPDHQFHGFLVLTIFSFFALFQIGLKSRLAGGLVIALGIHAAFFDGITSPPFSAILNQGINAEHLHYTPDASWTADGPARLWHDEVKLLAEGRQRSITQLSEDEFQAYFGAEPRDIESIASLWVVPSAVLTTTCEK